MEDCPLFEHRNARTAGSYIDRHDAEFLLALREHRFGNGNSRRDNGVDIHPRLIHAFLHILHMLDLPRNNVGIHLQSDTAHPYGILDSALLIHRVAFGLHMQNAAVCRNTHCLRRLKDARDIFHRNLGSRDRNNPAAAERFNVRAAQTDKDMVDRDAGHPLCILHGGDDVMNGLLNINDLPFAHAKRGGDSHPDDIRSLFLVLHHRHHCPDLKASDIETGEYAFLRHRGKRKIW